MRTHVQMVETMDVSYPNPSSKGPVTVQATVLLKRLSPPSLETRIRVVLEEENLPAMTQDQLRGWILDTLRQALAAG